MVELFLRTAIPRPTGDYIILDDYFMWSPEWEVVKLDEAHLSPVGIPCYHWYWRTY